MTAQTKRTKPARRKTGAAKTASPPQPQPRPSGDRTALIARMWRAADAQVCEIETRLLQDSHEPLERERDARVLAVLAKTLRELSALDATKQRKHTAAPADDDAVPRDSQGDIPRDMGDLRRSLARKLEALIAGRKADLPREP